MSKYLGCWECMGLCCSILAFHPSSKEALVGEGLLLHPTEMCPDPALYYSLHEGITLVDDMFLTISKGIPCVEVDRAGGKVLIFYSRCTLLNDKGNCDDYKTRPETCRLFNQINASYFIVPAKCCYSTKRNRVIIPPEPKGDIADG